MYRHIQRAVESYTWFCCKFTAESDTLASTPPGMPGTHPPGISLQYYFVLSDIADQYWLPSVRSASSRFHSAIRRHQFASVGQADSRLTRLVPPTLNSRWRHRSDSNSFSYISVNIWGSYGHEFSVLFLLTQYQVIQISKSQSELPAYTTYQTMNDIIRILL